MSHRWIFALVASSIVCTTVLAMESAPQDPETHAPGSTDASLGLPFQEGESVTFDRLDGLEPYVPPPFWEYRKYFFFEGMELEIGPSFRQYGESDAYRRVTDENRGKSSIGQDGSLAGYTGGLPFPSDEINCANDPDAGTKIIWNFTKAWNGDGGKASFRYTYFDKGEQLAVYHEGTSRTILLKGRVEPQYHREEKSLGDIFKNETRAVVTGIEVAAPFESSGVRLLTYRYDSSDGPLDAADNDDSWIYLPGFRHARRYQTTHTTTGQRTEALFSSDYTMDDGRSFAGIPPQYAWSCLAATEVTFRTP